MHGGMIIWSFCLRKVNWIKGWLIKRFRGLYYALKDSLANERLILLWELPRFCDKRLLKLFIELIRRYVYFFIKFLRCLLFLTKVINF